MAREALRINLWVHGFHGQEPAPGTVLHWLGALWSIYIFLYIFIYIKKNGGVFYEVPTSYVDEKLLSSAIASLERRTQPKARAYLQVLGDAAVSQGTDFSGGGAHLLGSSMRFI